MTDKEILEAVKAEIERLHEEHRGSKGDWYYRLALRSILHFIKTLQEEPAKPSVDEAMAEVERKAKLFTEANKGKTSEEILAEMRGEEPVNEGLEEESKEWLRPQLDKSYANYGETKMMELTHFDGYAMLDAIEFGAKWQEANLWKPADGDDLPKIDREVVALLDNDKVVFAHRPPEYWDGKNIATGEVTRYYPKTYDKGGWNIPNVKYWLDVDLPKLED